ncbi:MAG: nucleoside triphosphate pyrophosphatase [Opitutales bacterium]|jgi:septum formation protein
MNTDFLPRILLASRSPRRSELLARDGIAFDIDVPIVDEWEASDADPRELVLHNAARKGDAAAAAHPGRLVLSADTTVALDGELLGKPADMAEARRMLARLSGRAHAVFTAVLLQRRSDGIRIERCEESRVVFRTLDEAALTRYFDIVNPLDKAGAYGIQEGREIIIDHFEGSLTNIMGLPMEALHEMLEQLAVSVGLKEESHRLP